MENTILESENRIDLITKIFPQQLKTKQKQSESLRQKHITNFERWYKKRFGIRPRVVNFPWPNAANLHLPLIDKSIRKAKPKFLRLIESVNPMATLVSNMRNEDMSLVLGMERKFDEILRYDINLPEKGALGIDRMLERGYFLAKTVQEFREVEVEESVSVDRLPSILREVIQSPDATDDDIGFAIADQYDMDPDDDDDVEQIKKAIQQLRAGKTRLKFKRTVDMAKHPSVYIRDAVKVLVPTYTTDIETAHWIRDRITTTLANIDSRAVSGVWHKGNALELLKRLEKGEREGSFTAGSGDKDKKEIDRLEDNRSGLMTTPGALPNIDEYYFHYKWPGDRLPSPSVLTMNTDNPDLPLRFIKFPYVDTFGRPDKWPFNQITFEIVSDKYHSQRGFPQMLDSLQTEVTNNHNAKQNYLTIATSLNMKVKKRANISHSFIPSQPLRVDRMDDVDVLQFGEKHDASYDNEERILRGWAEEYIGIENVLSRENDLTEPRTKAEVEKISAAQDEVSYGDTVIFQIGMNKLYQKIWNRLMQYGPDVFKLQAPDGTPIEVTKDEIRRRFAPRATGNVSNSSSETRKIEARNRLALYRENQYINQYELTRHALEFDDERVSRVLLLPQGEVVQNQVERQIMEIHMISMGYTSVPKMSDDDATHIKVIDDFINDQKKSRNLPPDRLESLLNHREAHKVAMEKKARATSRGGRTQQEVAKAAHGVFGREGRNAT